MTTAGTPPMALAGLRVLDLTFYLPGPFCTMMLADMGAEVIRVERPAVGDPARQMRVRMGDDAALHWWVNRNKKSIVLDLKEAEDRERFLELVRSSDVLVEGFRPGVADRLGIGYQACSRVNPGLIYCAISGYGQTGPHRTRPGHDLNYAAEAGMLDITGPRGGPPVMVGFPVTDVACGGMTAATAILGAYVHRLRTGEGQLIDISMLDGAVATVGMQLIHALAGTVPVRGLDMNSGGKPYYRLYETADGGHLAVGAIEPHFWAAFCTRIDRADLVDKQEDPAVPAVLEELLKTQDLAYWCRLLEDADACIAPVVPIDQVPEHPQVKARELITTMSDRHGRPWPQIANPIRFSRTPTALRTPAPELGEHTAEVLGSLEQPRLRREVT